ncbi:MAG: DJ-1/PfpI family protein [Halarcobacter sp.]
MNIGIYIYDNAEVLDFSGPYEVFSVANRFLEEKHNLFFISEKEEVIKARGEYKVLSDFTIETHPKLDVLIVVGGVHTEELEKQNVINWLTKQTKTCKLIASVCTGVFLLAKANIVTNHKVTTHWEDIEDLKTGVENKTLHPKDVKDSLAIEIVDRFHGEGCGEAAKAEFKKVFAKKDIPTDMDEYTFEAGTWIGAALVDSKLVNSTSQARRDIKAGAVKLNQEKVTDEKLNLEAGEYILQKGKKNFAKILIK